jgi:hypothetical protein
MGNVHAGVASPMTLLLPHAEWPCAWWDMDGSAVKMSCPACGGFSLLLTRTLPEGTVKTLACEACGISGVEAVQASFNSWTARQARAAAAHQNAAAEGDMLTAIQRNGRKIRA